jgi:general secretion pathway protein J
MSIMVNNNRGFTLLEILIALFIFTIISLMLAGGLRIVIDTQSTTEKHAEQLRQLQIAFLLLSRDITQIVNRPIVNSHGREERPVVGESAQFAFTHMGLANSTSSIARSSMERTRYEWHDHALWRTSWPALDQAPETISHSRKILSNVDDMKIDYLDNGHAFRQQWPIAGEAKQVLPRAIKITLTITDAGSVSQLYVISTQADDVEKH